MAMYYNKKMYQDAGIGAPPTSWSDFVQVGKQLTAGGRFGVGEAASEPPHAWHVLWLLTTQLGGRLISADGKQALLDSPPVLQAATSWLDWMAKYKIVNTGDVTHGWAEQTTQFIARKSAMFPFGFQSVMSSLANTGISDEWSLAANPTIPYGMNAIPGGGKPAQTFLGGNLWAIFKHGKNKDLAFELAKIMTSPDIQYMYWKELSGLPVTQDTYTQHPEAKQGVWKVLYDAALNAEPLPWTPAFGQVSPLLAAAVKPSFAEMSGGGNYNLAGLKAQLTTANQKLAEALKSQR
jgi:multiple sugar transport system substrate-binding protein